MPEKQQPQRPTGIAAAAIEGGREGEPAAEATTNPDNDAAMARPAPGMTDPRGPNSTGGANPGGGVSSTGEQTGITGGVTDEQEDDEQEWRRAGGSAQ